MLGRVHLARCSPTSHHADQLSANFPVQARRKATGPNRAAKTRMRINFLRCYVQATDLFQNLTLLRQKWRHDTQQLPALITLGTNVHHGQQHAKDSLGGRRCRVRGCAHRYSSRVFVALPAACLDVGQWSQGCRGRDSPVAPSLRASCRSHPGHAGRHGMLCLMPDA